MPKIHGNLYRVNFYSRWVYLFNKLYVTLCEKEKTNTWSVSIYDKIGLDLSIENWMERHVRCDKTRERSNCERILEILKLFLNSILKFRTNIIETQNRICKTFVR